jgi:membrane protein YqaA with SNARE-associated domain
MTIVIPPKPVQQHFQTPNTTCAVDNDAYGTVSGPRQTGMMDAVHDELLLRKERALQKKQFKKRIVWDIAVWTLLLASMALVVSTICGFAGVWQP